MQKNSRPILKCFLICSLLHFNVTSFSQSTWSQKNDKEKKAADTSCLYIVNKKTSESMIDLFKSRYSFTGTANEVSGLKTEYWIEKCVFISLYNFISTNGDSYDGIRISWVDPYSSDLVIVPTSPISSPTNTFKHANRPDVTFRDICKPASRIINNKPSIFTNRTNDFGENFRLEKKRGDRSTASIDSLSAAVWFDKCVLRDIVRELSDPTKNLDGMTAFAAAYLKKDADSDARGQLYDNQSTIILVPTKNSETGHEPQWEIFDKHAAGGLNHGQLCPQICN